MLVSRRFFLSRVKILSFLKELEATAGTAKSLYISSGLPLPEVENLLERMLALQIALCGDAVGNHERRTYPHKDPPFSTFKLTVPNHCRP